MRLPLIFDDIFSNQSISRTILPNFPELARISPNLTKKTSKKYLQN